jgi:signal transduction histidine kinase
VLLIPLVWCVLFHRWAESAVVAVAVVAAETIASVAQHATGAATARRVLLWALVSGVILFSAHRLRDELGRSHTRTVELQSQLTQLTLAQDRDRIAASLHDQVITKLFAAGLTIQTAAAADPDALAARRIEQAVGEVDEAIVLLRNAIFGLSASSQGRPSLRQRVLDLCGALEPAPEVTFAGLVDDALPAAGQDQILALLREAMTLIGAEGAITVVAIEESAAGLALRCAARLCGQAAGELTELEQSARRAGVGFEAVPGAEEHALTWRIVARVADTAGA